MSQRSRRLRRCSICTPWYRLGNGAERRPYADRRQLQDEE